MVELTVLEARAISLHLAGYSQRDIAIKIGVRPETLVSWNKKEHYKKAKKEALDKLYTAALAELTEGMQLAVRELIKIIEDPDTPQRTKIQAISCLFNNVSKNKVQSSVSEVLENNSMSIDSLVKTASNRQELIEALELKFKYENWQYNQASKMTETAFKDGMSQIVSAISKRVNPEILEEILNEIRNNTQNTDAGTQINITD